MDNIKYPRTPFIDAQKAHYDNPYAFEIPSDEELNNIEAGDWVKVATGHERFWVKVMEANNMVIIGSVDNEIFLNIHGLRYGDIISFQRKNIYAIEKKEGEFKKVMEEKAKSRKPTSIIEKVLGFKISNKKGDKPKIKEDQDSPPIEKPLESPDLSPQPNANNEAPNDTPLKDLNEKPEAFNPVEKENIESPDQKGGIEKKKKKPIKDTPTPFDYFFMYFGCLIQRASGDNARLTGIWFEGDFIHMKYDDREQFRFFKDAIPHKPILRQISDMTKEEMMYVGKNINSHNRLPQTQSGVQILDALFFEKGAKLTASSDSPFVNDDGTDFEIREDVIGFLIKDYYDDEDETVGRIFEESGWGWFTNFSNEMSADLLHYLIKHEFDVFGLIEKGMAISNKQNLNKIS